MKEFKAPIIQRTFVLPRHPDDDHIPDSILNIYLGPGRIVTIQAPLFSKTMATLSDFLAIPGVKESLVIREKSETDYEI